jgi:hypothetical protein
VAVGGGAAAAAAAGGGGSGGGGQLTGSALPGWWGLRCLANIFVL